MSSPASASLPRTERLNCFSWTLLVASSVLYFGLVNEADNDLWGHVFAGREILRLGTIPRVDPYSYTVAGQPWFNHEWLTHVAFGTVFNAAGNAGLLLFKLALSVAMFALTLLGVVQALRWNVGRADAASAGRDVWIWGSVSVLTLAVLARGLAIRPQLLTYLLFALLLTILDRATRGQRRLLWVLPPVFTLWANLHGGFVLGVAVLGLYAAWSAVLASERTLLPMMVTASCVVATALNPYGPSLLTYLWDELSRSHPISEWQPVDFGTAEHTAFFVMLTLFVATLPFLRDWRSWGWRPLVALIVALFALRHQRHTAVFALCAAVPLAMQLRVASAWLSARGVALSEAAQRLVAAGLIALAATQFASTAVGLWKSGLEVTFDASEYPVAAVAALKAAGARGNLAVPLDWGAYVLWHLAPAIKPSIDGRFATVYPEPLVNDNFAFFRGTADWRRLIEAYPTDAALVPSGVAWPITREPGWERIYADEVASIYVRADRRAAFQLGPGGKQPVAAVFP